MSRLGFNDQAYETLRQMGLVPLHEPYYEAPVPTPPDNPWDLEVADANARLSLPSNTPVGTIVHQVDNNTNYQLNAPSATQGGVFVSGGTQDGIYPNYVVEDGKQGFKWLGESDDGEFHYVRWRNSGVGPGVTGSAGWAIGYTGDSVLYYSLSDVATPDLASNWKNASDDTPTSITVTSISLGELYAGAVVAGAGDVAANGAFTANSPAGNGTGRMYYGDQSSGNFLFWTTGVWRGTEAAFGSDLYDATNGAAFPFGLTYDVGADGTAPAPTVTRSDVANERNWEVVP